MTPTAQAPAEIIAPQYALGRSLARQPLSHPRQLRTLIASIHRRIRATFRSPAHRPSLQLDPHQVHLPLITSLNQSPLRLPF